MNIVCISGGISSAWVAWWAKNNLPKKNTIYYFNDTKWEHPDLYRFLEDVKKWLDIEILEDSDGRTPEQVFYDQNMIGSNRAPICSKVLKAKRLQKYCKPGDVLYFGIDTGEMRRVGRIAPVYARLQCETRFPIIETITRRAEMEALLKWSKIELPEMYKQGFKHNNCHGGCVRAGVKTWKLLYQVYPEVYKDRERIETEFREGQYTFIKGLSLKRLREIIENQIAFDYENHESEFEWHGECIGICHNMN